MELRTVCKSSEELWRGPKVRGPHWEDDPSRSDRGTWGPDWMQDNVKKFQNPRLSADVLADVPVPPSSFSSHPLWRLFGLHVGWSLLWLLI